MRQHTPKLAREIVEGVLDALPHLGGRIVKRASGYALEFRGPIVSRTSGAEREPMDVMIEYVQKKLAAAPDMQALRDLIADHDQVRHRGRWLDCEDALWMNARAAIAEAGPINAPASAERSEDAAS